MDRAVQTWVSEISSGLKDGNEIGKLSISEVIRTLSRKLTRSYTVYRPMLLLPATALEGDEWNAFRSSVCKDEQQWRQQLHKLFSLIALSMKVTHIAINRPIPLLHDGAVENVLRAPVNFTPLLGDFGPSALLPPELTATEVLPKAIPARPSARDFEAAFWVTAKQNGIFQTWAPRWTMFSRGNISEKARLLTLQSVQDAVAQGRETGFGSAAVDLYAGIGYFAFSYARAGVDKVLCWDLNAWSMEGLRRGAAQNKWAVSSLENVTRTIYDGDHRKEANSIESDAEMSSATTDHLLHSDARFLLFNETNVLAPKRIDQLRSGLPPIRHINCGMLPSSRAGLSLAVEVADVQAGAWIHVHENFLIEEIEARAEETRVEALRLWCAKCGLAPSARLDGIHRVKSYAPGVMHCVLDIHLECVGSGSPMD